MRLKPAGTRDASALVSPQAITDPSAITAAPTEAVVATASAGVASAGTADSEPEADDTAPVRWRSRAWSSREAKPTTPVRLVRPG